MDERKLSETNGRNRQFLHTRLFNFRTSSISQRFHFISCFQAKGGYVRISTQEPTESNSTSLCDDDDDDDDDENQSLSVHDPEKNIEQHALYPELSAANYRRPPTDPFIKGLTIDFARDNVLRYAPRGQASADHWANIFPLLEIRAQLKKRLAKPCYRIFGYESPNVRDKAANDTFRFVTDLARKLFCLGTFFGHCKMKLWVVLVSWQDLHPDFGLLDEKRDLIRLIVQLLLKISPPSVRILLSGLHYQRGISKRMVDTASGKLDALASLMNANLGREAVFFIPQPDGFSAEMHLDYEGRLNEEGKYLWRKRLYPRALSLYCNMDHEEAIEKTNAWMEKRKSVEREKRGIWRK